MRPLPELELFERLLERPRNELVEAALDAGRHAIGYNCQMVPEPLLAMGGAFPVRLRAPGVTSTEQATHYMSPFVCSYVRSLLEAGLDGAFDFLSGMVDAASCVHCIRCVHNMERLQVGTDKGGWFSVMLDPPRKEFAPAIAKLARDMRRTAGIMAANLGIDTSDDALRQSIRAHNRFYALLGRLSDLRKEAAPRITGTEFHTVIVAARSAPKDLLMEPLEALLAAAQARPGSTGHRARILVLGSIFDNPRFTGLIEEQGALVVADRYCFGSLPGMEAISEEGDPFEALARHSVCGSECPRMMEKIEDRHRQVRAWMAAFNAEGILFENLKFCDLWGYEGLTAMDRLRAEGIPAVRIEREYAFTAEGQLRTRVQAFVELLENRKLAMILGR